MDVTQLCLSSKCVCVQLAERSRELASVRGELCRLQQRGSQQSEERVAREERERQQATELRRLRSESQLTQEQASTI